MKHVLLFSACLAMMSSAALADKLSVKSVSSYLNSFSTAKAAFTQVNSDGSISTGELSMRRPGRARFDYAKDNGLVIAGGGQVAIFDPVSNTPPEQYPLKRTPLSHVLAKNVNLAQSGMLVAHKYDGTATSVVLQDPKHPEYGNIRLVFTDAPVTLRQWVITNDSGDQTTVILGDFRTGVRIPARLFSIPHEANARGLN